MRLPHSCRRCSERPGRRFRSLVVCLTLPLAPVLVSGCTDSPTLGVAPETALAQTSDARRAPADSGTASDGTAARATDSGKSVAARLPDRDGEDWPFFLGPRHTGVSGERGLLDAWPPDGPPLIWARDVGAGYSAPSVMGNRLVVHHRVANEEIVECLQADTGQTLWKHAYPSRFRDPYGYNNGPRCSPVLTADRCYTFGAEGRLVCLDLETGRQIWLRDTQADFSVPEAFFGVGATPILEGNRLIVLVGGQPDSGVVAFDAETGATQWESVGKSTWDGAETGDPGNPRYTWTGEEMVVSYSSPIAATIHGRRHILCLMRQGLVSVDPESGAENFHYWFMSRTYESVNAARPVVVDDTILLSAAYRVGSALLKVAKDGRSVEKVWRDPRNLLTHWSTAIHHAGHFYGFSGRHEQEGTLRCLRALDGKVVWESNGWEQGTESLARGPDGTILDVATNQPIPWPYYGRGSAIMAEGKFIVLAERGTLALVEVNPQEWREISRCTAPRMHYPCWAAPVLSRGRLYLRCEDALVCLDLLRPSH